MVVLAEAKAEYDERHPRGDEAVLVVEISDTTIQPDLSIKRNLYGRANVRDYWVLDLNAQRLVVHREVDAARSDYRNVQSYGASESVDVDRRAIPVTEMLL